MKNIFLFKKINKFISFYNLKKKSILVNYKEQEKIILIINKDKSKTLSEKII
jgi:hypothetical protein